jgi:hypothetical protein
MSEDRREIARLCEHLSLLRAEAAAVGLDGRLDALVSAAAAGRAEGVTDFLRRMGVPETPAVRAPGGIVYPPTKQERPHVEVYGCPGDVCERGWVRRPGVRIPQCAVRGAELRRRPAP